MLRCAAPLSRRRCSESPFWSELRAACRTSARDVLGASPHFSPALVARATRCRCGCGRTRARRHGRRRRRHSCALCRAGWSERVRRTRECVRRTHEHLAQPQRVHRRPQTRSGEKCGLGACAVKRCAGSLRAATASDGPLGARASCPRTRRQARIPSRLRTQCALRRIARARCPRPQGPVGSSSRSELPTRPLGRARCPQIQRPTPR